MSTRSTPPEPAAAIAGRLRLPLERARAGDPAALAELRRVLDEHPEVWRRAGDLAAHVEGVWLDLVARSDASVRECLARHLAEIRRELAGPAPTMVERLLAERAAACWLQLQLADMASAEALTRDHSKVMGNHMHRRQDSAHRHYMAALSALTTVRKLLPSTSGPPGSRTVPDTPATASGEATAAHQPAPPTPAREAATA